MDDESFYIKLFSISPTNIKVATQEVARNSPALTLESLESSCSSAADNNGLTLRSRPFSERLRKVDEDFNIHWSRWKAANSV